MFSLPFAVFDVWSVDFDVVSVIGGLHAFFLELVCTYTIFKFIFIQNLLPGPLLVFSIYLYFFMKFLSLYPFVPLLFLLSGSSLESDYFRFLVIRRLVLYYVVICVLPIFCMYCLPGNK